MSNWFENNQTKSVILYTILVAGTTWTIFNVLLDDKKLASAKAEVDQYKAKTEVLEAQISQLKDENQKYRSWLAETPGTIPYFESEIAKAKELTLSVKAAIPTVEPNISTAEGRAAVLTRGESLADPVTGAIVGVGTFHPDFTVDINITTPDGKTQSHPSSKAGEVWDFSYKSAQYRITLSRSDWYKNEATVSLRELN
ncbi:hypothetical protein [Frateuria sp. Soil773]|uniref:hypothetical protein n=1 Tax=Frateuria sp. Soil773 TaxID=1736407 RepID=UPI0012F8BEE2|nr:hypothetical protein [Frateuria sp. Soil773]